MAISGSGSRTNGLARRSAPQLRPPLRVMRRLAIDVACQRSRDLSTDGPAGEPNGRALARNPRSARRDETALCSPQGRRGGPLSPCRQWLRLWTSGVADAASRQQKARLAGASEERMKGLEPSYWRDALGDHVRAAPVLTLAEVGARLDRIRARGPSAYVDDQHHAPAVGALVDESFRV